MNKLYNTNQKFQNQKANSYYKKLKIKKKQNLRIKICNFKLRKHK